MLNSAFGYLSIHSLIIILLLSFNNNNNNYYYYYYYLMRVCFSIHHTTNLPFNASQIQKLNANGPSSHAIELKPHVTGKWIVDDRAPGR